MGPMTPRRAFTERPLGLAAEATMAEKIVCEAVGVFPDAGALQAAVDELLLNGFDRSYLSLMATSATVERELGQRFRRVEDLADDPNAPRSEEHTSELQSLAYLVCRLLLEKKKKK